MKSEKTEALNLRMSAKIKQLLRRAADAEHRRQTNLSEKLVHNYCAVSGLVSIVSTMAPSAVLSASSEA